MKVLLLSAIFPPDILGGAEIAAEQFAHWLAGRGHTVAVLATAKTAAEAGWRRQDDLKVFRASMPRPYPAHAAARASFRKKIMWHLQDHFDPRNSMILRRIVDEFEPDVVNIQGLQGIGYNAIAELGAHDLPVVFTLHDLGLACIKMSMFQKGQNCSRQCRLCRISARFKWRELNKLRRLSFWSPSRFLLERLRDTTSVHRWPSKVIKYPLTFVSPGKTREPSGVVQLLYVGRLHPTKGVEFLLGALRRLSRANRSTRFLITIAGTGPSEERLRQEYAGVEWCRFLGFVPRERVADVMVQADVLCVPSLWAENSPLVVYQALSIGLPVVVSDAGGLPEMIKPDETGLVLPAGDEDAWCTALERLLTEPGLLRTLQGKAGRLSGGSQVDKLGEDVLSLFLSTMNPSEGSSP